jgi:hypothetical protein
MPIGQLIQIELSHRSAIVGSRLNLIGLVAENLAIKANHAHLHLEGTRFAQVDQVDRIVGKIELRMTGSQAFWVP